MCLCYRASFIVLVLCVLNACKSEYRSSEILLSATQGVIQAQSNEAITGTLNIERPYLQVEFVNGFPNGRIHALDEHGNTIIEAQLVPKKRTFSPKSVQRINQGMQNNKISVYQYIKLIEALSDYDGNYYYKSKAGEVTEGTYQAGQKNHAWKTVCENGQIKESVHYSIQQNKAIKTGKEQINTCDGKVLLEANRNSLGVLEGKYVENTILTHNSKAKSATQLNAPSKVVIPKLKTHYSNGKRNGSHQEYGADGVLLRQVEYKDGVKDGEEVHYFAAETSEGDTIQVDEQWINKAGQKNGWYQSFDTDGSLLSKGQYQSNRPIGIWEHLDKWKNQRAFYDYTQSNFIQANADDFISACDFPANQYAVLEWHTKVNKLQSCREYIQQHPQVIHKKLDKDFQAKFKVSKNWTYPIIIAKPKVYDLLKAAGAKTEMRDSQGRTRLHHCIRQFPSYYYNKTGCNAELAMRYLVDVDANAVSNTGTALHLLAQYSYLRQHNKVKKSQHAATMPLLDILLQSTDINLTNIKGQTPLMLALQYGNYTMADKLLAAGAKVNQKDNEGRTELGYLFIDDRNQWRKKKLHPQAEKVLARMIQAGLQDEIALGNKTVAQLSKEHRTPFHLTSLRKAKQSSIQ